MARSDRRHAPRRLRWLAPLVVIVLLAGGATAWQRGVLDPWLDRDVPDPTTEPAAVPAPQGLHLPALGDPAPVAQPLVGGPLPTRAEVRRAVAAGLGNRDLGRDVHAVVADLTTGRTLLRDGTGLATPASTLKLLTCTAALAALGPDHRFTTEVVRQGHTLTLVGGGDPLLARTQDPDGWPQVADLATLARDTARALRFDGVRRVRLGYDTSLFSGPAASPAWEATYLPEGVVSPISSLWVDEGRVAGSYAREEDPARTAAEEFAADLRRAGILVADRVAQAEGRGRRVASAQSPPLRQIVEHTLLLSDNEAAEVLAHQVGVAVTGAGSFAGGVEGVTRTLGDLGIDLDGASLHDGSGLARADRLDPDSLVDVLRAAATHDDLRAVLTGLPVAGFTGSLAFRFDSVPRAGVGLVRAKTGTLRGVSALAGLAETRGGRLLVFVVDADRVRLDHATDARDVLDRVAARLAAAA